MSRSTVASAVVAALIASFLAVGGAASSATAGDPGSISGTVTISGGTAAVAVNVSVFETASGSYVTEATTNGSGEYTLTGLSPNSYQVRFEPSNAGFAPEWWNNALTRETSSAIELPGGANITGYNAVLEPAVIISGTVRNAASEPISGVTVIAYTTGGQTDENWLGSASTDLSGHYSITGLAARSFTLKFTDPYGAFGQEWWSDKQTYSSATFFSTTAGTTYTRDAVMLPVGAIAGRVTNSSGTGLGGITVRAFTVDGDEIWHDETTSAGDYAIGHLGVGNYALKFDTPSGSPYATKWWENAASRADADSIAVEAGVGVPGYDVTLEAGSTIEGSILAAATSGAVENFTVLLYSANDISANLDSLLALAQSDASGHYSFDRLPVGGDYKIAVLYTEDVPITAAGAPAASQFDWVTQWYADDYSYATAETTSIASAGSLITRNVYMQQPHFQDATDPSSPFYESIEWMAASAISLGTPDEHGGRPLYKPLDSVSRQAMAVFLYRLSQATFTPPATASFADVPVGHPFFTAIEWMKAAGISTGTPQPSGLPLFKPTDPVSRQSMATFLSRYAEATLPPGEPTTQVFADVPTTASTARAIEWMKNTGISTGTPQPSGLPLYKPADPVSRQSMALFLQRLNNYLFPI